MAMKKEITLGNLLSIFVPTFVLLLGWGISVTTRIEKQDTRIEQVEKSALKNETKIEKVDDKLEENFKVIQNKLDRILYQRIEDND